MGADSLVRALTAHPIPSRKREGIVLRARTYCFIVLNSVFCAFGTRYAFGTIYFIRYVGFADAICSATRNVKEKIRLRADFSHFY